MNTSVAFASVVVMAALPAFAQEADAGEADAGVQASAGSSMLDEIDAAAGSPVKAQSQAPQPVSSVPQAVARAFQSLNPDISAIIDASGGGFVHDPYSLAGDDPELRGGNSEHPAGFAVQEVELALSAVVDPYLRADVYLTIPNLSGLEVEEAFATSTSLPGGLQVKAGIFRSAFGRQNGQHLHLQDFTRRPLINEAFLGADGLRSPGLQVSWLLPVSFYLQWTLEAFSVAPPEDPTHLSSFGGGQRTDLTYTTELKTFIPASESVSIYGGLNGATGLSGSNNGFATPIPRRSVVEGLDLYVKYKPPNQADGYFSLAWTTEVFMRQLPELGENDGGFYTQLVLQLARRWFVGVREEMLGTPSTENQSKVQRTSLMTTFVMSEFARLRLYGERETRPAAGTSIFGGPDNYGVLLQLEVAIGAHGAHPF
ncbi:MAG: hypothetical protein QM723_29190 [Myxococcaceae bacterium]